MKVTFLGAAHEVTGSCTLLEVGDKKGVIDCGMEQGKDVYENQPLPVVSRVIGQSAEILKKFLYNLDKPPPAVINLIRMT